jgi:hypothetical protein
MFRDLQQNLHCGLPFSGIVLCLGQFGDVPRGVAKRDQRFPARQYDRIEKPLIPRHEFIPYGNLCRELGLLLRLAPFIVAAQSARKGK